MRLAACRFDYSSTQSSSKSPLRRLVCGLTGARFALLAKDLLLGRIQVCCRFFSAGATHVSEFPSAFGGYTRS